MILFVNPNALIYFYLMIILFKLSIFLLHRFKANFNVILTIFQHHSHSFLLFFQTKPLRRKNGVGVRREMKKKKKEIEKIGLRVNLYFPLWVFLMECIEK